MSWSASLKKPVPREAAASAIDKFLEYPQSGVENPPIEYNAALAQFEAAKEAAKELVKIIPGRFVMVSLSGHANGVGWQKKEGWSNDCITISVSQVCDADMQHYQSSA